MYSGKSTFGRLLAKTLEVGFYDLDVLFEKRYHTTIPIFFHRYGEEAFRKLERIVLEETERYDDCVISTGGGTPCYGDNMHWIRCHGTSIYLEISLEGVLSRHGRSKKTRPLLAGMNEEERRAYILAQMRQRNPFYRQADITLDALAPNIDTVINYLRKNEGRE